MESLILGQIEYGIGLLNNLRKRYQGTKRNRDLCEELIKGFNEVHEKLEGLQSSKVPASIEKDWISKLNNLKSYFDDTVSTLGSLWSKLDSKSRLNLGVLIGASRSKEKLEKLTKDFEKLDSKAWLLSIAGMIMLGVRQDGGPSSHQDGQFVPTFNVPENPSGVLVNFDDPDTMESVLKGRVLDECSTVVGAVGAKSTSAVAATGMGGVGKTSALKAVGADKEVQDHYTGGVYFFALGQNVNSAEFIKVVAGAVESTRGVRVAKEMSDEQNVGIAMGKAANWFAGKRCLFLCDDLWRTNSNPYGYFYDLKALIPSDSSSCMLISTRDLTLAEEIPRENRVHFSQRPDDVAEAMLCEYAGIGVEQHVRSSFSSVLQWCGGLPITLAVAGRAVKRIADRAREPSSAWSRFENELEENSRESLGKKRAGGHSGLFHALSVSLKGAGGLPEFQNVCGEYSIEEIHRALCVLKKPVWAPYSMLACLWKVTEGGAGKIAEEMEALSLVNIEDRDFWGKSVLGVKLHDLVHDFCVEEARNVEGLVRWHARLLEGYISRRELSKQESKEGFCAHNWWSSKLEDDNYLHAHLTYHLAESRRQKELESVMLNFRWTYRQLKVNGFLTLQDDFELFRTSQCGRKPERGSKHPLGADKQDKESTDTGSSSKDASKNNERDQNSVNLAGHVNLIITALRFSWPRLVSQESEFREGELAFEMIGRLCSLRCMPAVDKYLRSVESETKGPWAKPLGPCLEVPGGPTYGKFHTSPPVSAVSEIHGTNFGVAGDLDGNLILYNLKSIEIQRIWKGHEGEVRSVAASGDGRRIVSGSEDGKVRIWDTETGEAVGEPLQGHEDWVESVGLSMDGQRVVSGSLDRTVRIWDTETGKPSGKPLQGHEEGVTSVAISGDGQRIVSGSDDGTVRIWDMETGEAIGKPLRCHHKGITSVAVSWDGRRIVSGSSDYTVRIWDMETGEAVGEPLRGHDDGVMSVAVSGDGQRIVSGSFDGTVRVWDMETGEVVREPLRGGETRITSLAVCWDGRRIVSGAMDGTVRLSDVEMGEAAGEPLQSDEDEVISVAVSGDGQRIVSGSMDGTVRVWDMETGEAVGEPLRGHGSMITSVAVSGDGRRIVSGSCDQTVRIWDMETREAVGEPLGGHEDDVMSVAASEDGQWIVSGSCDRTVRIWNMETGEAVGEPLRGHGAGVGSVAVSGDGRRIVSGSEDGTVRIWDMETGEAVGGPLQGHENAVESVAVSGDGRRIVSSSWDGMVRIWNMETGEAVGDQLERHEREVTSVARSGLLDEFIRRDPGNDARRSDEIHAARSLTSRTFCVTKHNGIFYGYIANGTSSMKIGSFECEVCAWLLDTEGKLWAWLEDGTLTVIRTMK